MHMFNFEKGLVSNVVSNLHVFITDG